MQTSILHFQFSPLLRIVAALLLSLSVTAHAQSTSADEALKSAQASIAKRDWTAAESILQSLAKTQPANPFVFYEMAQVYESTNRLDAAKQIYQGIATLPDAAQRQYTIVVRSPNGSYMTSLVSVAQAKFNHLEAVTAAAKPPAAPAPAVASVTTTPAPIPAAPAANASTAVTTAMQHWAKFWVNKDLKGYFASYTSGYKGDKANADAWKSFRTHQINSKKTIGLDFGDVQVTPLSVDKMQVSFKQLYTSESFKDVTNKTMVWVKQGSVWLIEKESAK